VSEQSPVLPILERGAAALGLQLHPDQLRCFALLSQELISWNQRVNLTSVTNPDDVQLRHFVDSLTIVPVVQGELSSGSGRLIDVGSGAGLPGLAVAIALPWLDVALLEATAKKVRFLEHAVETLRARNARVLHGRAESLARQAEHREAYDVAVARAVGSTATLVELLTPFLTVGGIAVLMTTRAALDAELDRAAGALEKLHADVEAVRGTHVAGLDNHALLLIRKHGSTPTEFPRRPGVPERHPLAATGS